MSMSICEVKAAFHQVVSEEFKDIPQEDTIEWNFSQRFVKRMSKLIRNEKSFTWKYINTAKKRLVVVAVIIIALFITACSVKPIRTSVVSLFKEITEVFTHVTFTGDTTNKIENKYTITAIPSDYNVTAEYSDNNFYLIEWKSLNNHVIQLSQSITKETNTFLDNEALSYQDVIINNISVDVGVSHQPCKQNNQSIKW